MMCFWVNTTTHYYSRKGNHSVVALRMQIQLHLKWRFVLISLGFYDHWNRELSTVVLHPSPLAVVHVVRVGSKEVVGCDN